MIESRDNSDFNAEGGSGESDSLNDLDIEKLKQSARNSVFYILAIFILAFSGAHIFIRYSKPVFESGSQLKLNVQNEAVILGVQNPLENSGINTLSGEIELLKSNLFFSRVVQAISYNVSYHYYGSILTEERYKNSPFVVSYRLHNQAFYDKPIDLEILSPTEFELSYEVGDDLISSIHKFGEDISTSNYNLKIEKTENFSGDNGIGKYYFIINSEAALINYFQSNVTVQPLNFSAKTIQISLRDFNKTKARDFVTAIDTLYLNYTREEKNRAIEQKLAFLNQQLKITEGKIEEYEDYFENFTIENKTTNIQTDLGRTIVLLQSLDSQRFDLQNKLTNIQIAKDQIDRDEPLLLSSYGANALPNYISSSLSEYNKLHSEKEALLGSYNENTFAVSRMTQRLATLKSSVKQLIGEYEANLLKSIRELQARKASLEANFVELPSMGTEFNKTRRFYTLQEEFYFSLIKSKAELEIAKAGTVEDFDILSPASMPATPVYPQQLMIYGIGAVSGILISLLFIGIRYLLDDKISNQAELERMVNVPVLGSVPAYKREKILATTLLVHKIPQSILSESLRTIRTNMDFMRNGAEKRVVAITSTVGGEGKTFIAVNLAGILANTGKSILVVDLDMRKPKVNLAFGQEKIVNGVSTVLIGRDKFEDCVVKSDVAGLSYMPAGPIPPNPSELLLSDKFDKFIKKAAENYDMVIVDTPPVGLVTDGVIVMKKADLTLYVIRADYSKKVFLQSLKKLIRMNKFANISLILNSVKVRSMNTYGYGYGYGYYDEGEQK